MRHHLIIITLLFSVYRTVISYENYGRIHGQHRIFPTDAVLAEVFGGDGDIFCSRDLKGYFECNEDSATYKMCPNNTRCGCDLDKKSCESKPLCVPYKKPSPMIANGTFRFHGYNFIDYFHYNYYEKDKKKWKIYNRTLHGVVKQDVDQGMYLQLTTSRDWGGTSFELIKPDSNGSFVKVRAYFIFHFSFK